MWAPAAIGLKKVDVLSARAERHLQATSTPLRRDSFSPLALYIHPAAAALVIKQSRSHSAQLINL